MLSPLNYLSVYEVKFFGMSSFTNVELYHWYFSFKINFITIPSAKQYIMEWIDRNTSWQKEFFWMGWVLTHTIWIKSSFLKKKFILLYVSQKHLEWCKVEHNESIYFLYLDSFFVFFFLKKDYKLRKTFFLLKEKFFNFDFEGMKSFWEDALNIKDIFT